MRIIRYPKRREWGAIVERPRMDATRLRGTVEEVLGDVRARGDAAVIDYERQFDKVDLSSLLVTRAERDEAELRVDSRLREAMVTAHHNIKAFHEAQRFAGIRVETMEGVTCWQKSVAIERVGLYIPGGTAPLFSTLLMLATPAKIAGCKEIVVCTPPDRQGGVNAAILVAAGIAGVDHIYKAGGVQAIGAMAYGTATIPRVYKIFGPGNQYVMAAKQRVSMEGVAIDMPAGPSEVCVIADGGANASFVAADLLSQAEHGTDSQVMMITTDEAMAEAVEREVERQIEALPRREMARMSLCNSKIVVVRDTDEAMDIANAYAPEHLIIQTADSGRLAERVVNAGSVFIGRYACESAGDYASGTNHTLPTHGYATAYSGVNIDSYCRKITFQELTIQGVKNIGGAVETMAQAEGLQAHKNAMTLRMEEATGQ